MSCPFRPDEAGGVRRLPARMRFAAILALGFALAASAETGANILSNGGFERFTGARRVGGWAYGRGWRAVEGAGVGASRAVVCEHADTETAALMRQDVRLEAKRIYVIEADIRIEGHIAGPHGKGVTVFAEWYDAAGKWIGGVYTEEQRTTDGGWRHVSSTSSAVPTNAALVRVGLGLSKGCTGKVTFDNVKLARWYNPRLQGLYTSAYRNIAADGPLELMAALDMTDGNRADFSGLFTWRGADGRTHSAPPATMDDAFARLTLDVRDLAPGRSNLAFTLFRRNGEIDARMEKPFERVRAVPHRAVAIDGLRRTCVGGRPFFPIGVYGGVKDMARAKAAGVNTLMLYGAPGRDVLERARTNGLMVVAGVNHVFAGMRHAPEGIRTEADEAGWLARYVDGIRFHPALLGWYAADELPLTMLPRLAARRDLLERLDPDHPVWAVLNHPRQTRSYLPAFDVAGADPYPIPRDPIVTAAQWTQAAVKGGGGRRAAWMVPQMFSWASYNRKDGRVPTREELRNMTWQCLAEGATGLFYFKWGDLSRNGPDTTFEGRLADLAAVTAEVAAFLPFLLSDEAPQAVKGAGGEVRARLFVREGERCLLAVNATRQPQHVTLSADGMPPQEMTLPPLEVTHVSVPR